MVDATWLADHIPQVVAADVRWRLGGPPGRDAYDAGHLPGAVFVDLDRDLAAPPGPGGRHPLPAPEDFAAAMAGLGVGDDDAVVAYDDAGGSTAARLGWMLDAPGHAAAVLDGGLAAWGGPLSTDPVRRPPAVFTARPWPAERLAEADLVADLGRRADAVVLDARAAERYRGDVEPVDARAGHVPGARNAPWPDNLDPATGRFLPPDRLAERYRALGAGEATEVVAYCGSGVTSCHTVLALRLAGLPPARLFAGSWSAWSADPARPVAVGAA